MIETPFTRAACLAMATLFDGMAVAYPIKRKHPARKLRNAKALAYHNRRKRNSSAAKNISRNILRGNTFRSSVGRSEPRRNQGPDLIQPQEAAHD